MLEMAWPRCSWSRQAVLCLTFPNSLNASLLQILYSQAIKADDTGAVILTYKLVDVSVSGKLDGVRCKIITWTEWGREILALKSLFRSQLAFHMPPDERQQVTLHSPLSTNLDPHVLRACTSLLSFAPCCCVQKLNHAAQLHTQGFCTAVLGLRQPSLTGETIDQLEPQVRLLVQSS